MKKMIVSSFYNTLINDEDAIPASTMLEIERLRNENILIAICTNRQYQEILEYNRDFPFVDYIIALNGSIIYDVRKGKILSKKKMTKPTIKKISEQFKESPINYYTEDNIYHSLEELGEKDIYKIEIETQEEKEKCLKLNVSTSMLKLHDKTFLEITSNRSSMFSGVDQISIKTETKLDNIIAIGSNESDYSLIQNIKNSYIVKNADSSLKKIAKKITVSNNEKGVEKILKKI